MKVINEISKKYFKSYFCCDDFNKISNAYFSCKKVGNSFMYLIKFETNEGSAYFLFDINKVELLSISNKCIKYICPVKRKNILLNIRKDVYFEQILKFAERHELNN